MSDVVLRESATAAPAAAAPIEVVWCRDAREREPAPEPTPCHAPRLGVADMLARAQGAAERGRIVTSLLRLTGFATFAYFALEYAQERVDGLYLHEAFTPATYRGDYVRHRHHDVDPRTALARLSNVPVVWDLQQLRHAAPTQADADCVDGFLRTLRDDALCSGVMYAMPVPDTRLHAFMSFTAPRRSRDWISPATLEQTLSIGLSVHRFASSHLIAASRTRAADRLNAFERELLLGIAEGASDKEIGRRLDTSAHNVDYHLRKLRKRFGVANRIQLTYLTSKLGLI